MRDVVFILLFSAGCAHPARGVEVAPPPVYETAEGRNTVRLELAEKLLDAGNSVDAQKILRLALTEGANPAEVKLLQGRALWADGLAPEAEALILEAKKGMPRDPRPYRILGIIQADTGRTDDAIATWRESLKYDGNDAATWNNLGFLLLSRREYPSAADALTKAVALDGSVPRYRMNLGFALSSLGRHADALDTFRSVGSEADAQANLALGLELAGDHAEALIHYHKALEADPNNVPANQGLSRLSGSSSEVHP